MNSVHIMRPGTFRSHGVANTFTEADLAAIAGGYDPELHEAPVVIGHPKTDAPAYGWVASLSTDEAGLHAQPHQVDATFAEMLKDKKFKKISVSLYSPTNPENPTDKWYLRHVGFLGAQPPAIKGLRQVELSESAAGVAEITVDFEESSWAWRTVSELFRALRERLIESDSQEAADKALPNYLIEELAREADRGATSESANYREQPNNPDDTSNPEDRNTDMSEPDIAAREAALTQRETALSAREEGLAKAEKTRKNKDTADFVESLVEAGRVLPCDQKALTAALQTLPEDQMVEFAEGDSAAAEHPVPAFFRDFLSRLPEQVDYAERSADDEGARSDARFGLPRGGNGDPDRAALHKRALEYAEKHKVDYPAAVMALENAA